VPSPFSQLTTTFSALCPVWEVLLTAIKVLNEFLLQIICNLFVNIKETGNIKSFVLVM
jgi:hypothetical protein